MGAVVPRPIAFVSTVSPEGVANLAPFSFFTVASANPPVLCFTTSFREPRKDTLVNVRATKEFVVNIVSEEFAAKMNVTSGGISVRSGRVRQVRADAGAERPGSSAAGEGIARQHGVQAASDRSR